MVTFRCLFSATQTYTLYLYSSVLHSTLAMTSSAVIGGGFTGGYFSRVSAALERPSRADVMISGPGYTIPEPGPGFRPAVSTEPQSCAALRTKGRGAAQPLMPAAMLRIRSVAEAPTPPQSSQALR